MFPTTAMNQHSKFRPKAPIYKESSQPFEPDTTLIEMVSVENSTFESTLSNQSHLVPEKSADLLATGEEGSRLINYQSVGQTQMSAITSDQLDQILSEEPIKIQSGFRKNRRILSKKNRAMLLNIKLFVRLLQIILTILLIAISGFLTAIIPTNALNFLASSTLSFLIILAIITAEMNFKYRKLWFVLFDMVVVMLMIFITIKSYQYHSLLRIEKINAMERHNYSVKNFEFYLKNRNKTDNFDDFSALIDELKLKNIDQFMKEKLQFVNNDKKDLILVPLRLKRDETSNEHLLNEILRNPNANETSTETSNHDETDNREEEYDEESDDGDEDSKDEESKDDENQEQEEIIDLTTESNETNLEDEDPITSKYYQDDTVRSFVDNFIIMERRVVKLISKLNISQIKINAYENETIPLLIQKLYNSKYSMFLGQMIDLRNKPSQNVDHLRHLLLLIEDAAKNQNQMPISLIESIQITGSRVKTMLINSIVISLAVSVLYLLIWGLNIPLFDLVG
jgi:hypothetical protein